MSAIYRETSYLGISMKIITVIEGYKMSCKQFVARPTSPAATTQSNTRIRKKE
jgi:hypothetical protein